MKKFTLWFVLPLAFLFSCSGDDLLVKEHTLVSHEKKGSFGTVEAEFVFTEMGMEDVLPDVKHQFKVYKVTYHTFYKEEKIKASALVAIPTTDNPLPLISFQHGTIVGHNEAPSKNIFDQLPLFSLAATGYIVVIPDFIGFGSSEDSFHPYYVADVMGESIFYAIQATLEMLPEVGAEHNEKIFLAGYSEGGFATMAAHKYIEENTEMNIVASAPASGGYDVKGMQEFFFDQETYDQPFYMAYVAMAYKNYYDWDSDLSEFFKEPYASRLDQLFDGTKTGSQINAQLTRVVKDLIQEDALQNFDVSAEYEQMVDALELNSLTNWAPEAPVFMYHGTSDVTVPYQNSVDAYNKLIEVPGNSVKIEFYPLEGGTHSTGVLPYVKDVYFRFKSLK